MKIDPDRKRIDWMKKYLEVIYFVYMSQCNNAIKYKYIEYKLSVNVKMFSYKILIWPSQTMVIH